LEPGNSLYLLRPAEPALQQEETASRMQREKTVKIKDQCLVEKGQACIMVQIEKKRNVS